MPNTPFDLTNLSGSSDFVGLISFGNEVTGDLFGLILLFIVFMVFYGGSASRGVRSEKSFLVASFTTMVSSWLMYAMGLVGVQISILMFGLVLIAAFVVGRGKED